MEEIVEAGPLTELIKEAQPRKTQLRGEIYQAVEETVRAGNYQAVYTAPSTKQVLDLERVTAELEAAGEDLATYQFEEHRVMVEDPGPLIRALAEAGIEDEAAGISVEAVPTVEEEWLKARLEGLGVLEACLDEKTTCRGYVSIRRLGGVG